ncbi:MAG: hypothetical protein CL671_14695 [Balneola sp.]|nr:hypothetical protein [Balneola sp.]MAO77040.1 hypothetical protein [Balneola sp.]MBF64607.1 hypothetical protein [Balneola sp.]MBF65859.1 hypothetical protein [Balneola sp.]HAW82109.1 hypothetical protein [Balneola sp.]
MSFKHSFQGIFVKHNFVDDYLNLRHSEMHKKRDFKYVTRNEKINFSHIYGRFYKNGTLV